MKKRSDPPGNANTVAEPHDFTQYYKKRGIFSKPRLGTKDGGVQVPHDFTQYFTKKELSAMTRSPGRRRKANYTLDGIFLLFKMVFIAALLMILIAILSPFLAPLICDAPRTPLSLP